MASIYENAIVTIAAGRANNDNEGFLSFRPERVYVEVFNEVNEDIYTIQAFPIALKHEFKGGFDVDMVDEPLSQRAWAFQERLLSVRTFHFGHTQVVFECRSHLYTEDGHSHPFSLDYLGQDSREKFPDIDQPVYREDIRWIDILHRFTERALSYPSDRFPALAGLARKYDKSPAHSVVGHLEYLAGLWRSNLLEGLCWFSSTPSRALEQYRAPSWSWASVDSQINHGGLGMYQDLAEVERAHVTASGQNPYGSVSAGWIQLCAPCLQAELATPEEPGRNSEAVISSAIKTINSIFNRSLFLVTKQSPRGEMVKESNI
jgi:hypothetical protein